MHAMTSHAGRASGDIPWLRCHGRLTVPAARRLGHVVRICAYGALAVLAVLPAAYAASPVRIRIAVLPFFLDDSSAAAAFGSAPTENPYLERSTDAAGRQLVKSGRYRLVSASGVHVDASEARRLWDCGRCAVVIARKLGAQEVLLGEVTKVSVVEFLVNLRLIDGRSGKILSSVTTPDVWLGTDYSWPIGVGWLVRNRLLSRTAASSTRPPG